MSDWNWKDDGPPEAPEMELEQEGGADTDAALVSAEALAEAATEPTATPPTPALVLVPSAGVSSTAQLEAVETPLGEPSPSTLPEVPEFLVEPNLLPAGELHLLGGAPMAGKSTLVAQLLRQFVDPDPLFLPSIQFARLAPEQLGVIFTDRPWSSNSRWFKTVGLEDIPHYALADDSDAPKFMSKLAPAGAPGVDLFRFCLDKLPSTVKFVVADVLTNAFLGNIFHQGIVHRHTIGMQNLLRERGLTLLGTAYGTKLKQGKQERYQRAIDRIIGASPMRGALSSILYLEAREESDQDYQRLSWYSRHSQEQAFALSRMPDSGLFAERRDISLTSSKVQEAPVLLPDASRQRKGGRPPDPSLVDKVLAVIAPGESISRPALAARASEAGVARATAYALFRRLVEDHTLVWDEQSGTLLRPAVAPPTPSSGPSGSHT